MGGYTSCRSPTSRWTSTCSATPAVIHARYSQIANYDAVNLSHVFRLTDVWARSDGKWQVVARHSSILELSAQLE